MKHEMNEQELEPDPLVGAALRWMEGEVPLDDVDWATMRTNIRNRAALPLARRRALRAASPRWVRPLIPIAVAASIAVVLWTGDFGGGDSAVTNIAPVTVGAALQPTIQEALLADVTEQEFRLLVADNDSDALLMIAASR
jgi:hypothetical protein